MPTLITAPGADDPFRSRVAVLVRMTNVTRRYVSSDVETIAQTVSDLAQHYGYDWDCWCAHREVPWWEEDEHPHTKTELFHVNRRLVGVCDAAIIHAHENGSAALGYLYRAFVEAPHHPPVLVLAHQTERLSKVWEGQAAHHLAVQFVRFGGNELGSLELRQQTWDWLNHHASAINDGPGRRRVVEESFRPHADALTTSWCSLSRDTRRDVASRLMLPEPALRELIGNPMWLASLSAHDFACLLESLDAAWHAEVTDAKDVLDSDEMAGWAVWSTNKPRELVLGVLRAAVRERRKSSIANELGDLTQPGGWESLRRRWEQGLVG